MPSLADHPSSSVVKLLNLGDSGAGKSGALVSLAEVGFKLHILDYDNGVDILANLLRGKPALANVEYETLRDTVIFSNGTPKIKPPPTGFKRAGEVLNEWKADTFTPADVIVIDTLSTMSSCAMNLVLHLNGRLNQRPHQADYGTMASMVLVLIDMLTAPDMNCNVVVNSHIRYINGEDENLKGLPNAMGQQIPKDIGKYFNTMILTHTKGSGQATRRLISTRPQGAVGVKVSNPIGIKDSYPLETGLADLFEDITGHRGPAPTKAK